MDIPFNRATLFPECYKAIEEGEAKGRLSGDGYNCDRVTSWFSEKFGYEHSLLTPSCTAALEMAALVLDIRPGDEVIVPSFTFVSSANAFALRGATIVFVDSQKEHPNLDPERMAELVTPNTKAFVVVHYGGVPVDLRPLQATGIPIVEDCAHAIGSVDPRSGNYVGLGGALACFSFHETKNIPIGEGGLLVVNDSSLWESAQIVREKGTNRTRFTEGRDPWYTWLSLGSSFLMSDIDAGILWGVLTHYDELQTRRESLWSTYSKSILQSSIWTKPSDRHKGNSHVYYLRFNNPGLVKDFIRWMKDDKILVTTHYKPLDLSPFVMKEYPQESCPLSQQWSNTLVRLPLFYSLDEESQTRIISRVNAFGAQEGLVMRLCETKDFEAIRQIRNSHRDAFIHSHVLAVEEHQAFMAKHSETYMVCESGEKVIGFIGHLSGDVRLGVDKDFLRKGVARFMMNVFQVRCPSIYVQVKRSNSRSLAFFASLGWFPVKSSTADPVPLERSTL